MKKLLIPASIILLGSSLAFADIENDDIVIFEGDTSNDIIIEGAVGEDVTLYFGDSFSHFLLWDADRNIFVFSDNVDFGGNQLLNMRIENLENAPVCEANSSGRLYHNTADNKSFVCNGTIWKQIDEEALNESGPYINSISPTSLNVGFVTTITILGEGFSPNTSVVIPGLVGTIGAVTVISPTELQIDINPDSTDSGNFDLIITSNGVTNETWNGNGVGILEIINTVTLIPAVGTVIWQREQLAVTSPGKILPADDSQDWEKGGSFGTVPENTDFVLSFTPVYKSGQSAGGYAMIGVDSSDPDHLYQSIDYSFYISNGTQLNIYENGTSRGSFGTFTLGDRLSIIREGSVIKYSVNGTIIYTSSVPSASSIVFDSSLYRWLGAENISLEY